LAETGSRELVAVDVCDRCGAQAYVLVTLPSGSELLYCIHHFREADTAKLAKLGATLNDQSRKLLEEVKQDREVTEK